ncbi:MFS transporter [Alphaproteobacteria bacterium]|jgi:MFS family permease|nr:MFS transporter [Alphaproteobacteria bacterium]
MLTIAPGLFMITLSAIALGAAFGGYLPLMALWMETLEISFQRIGIVSGTTAIGIVFSAYYAPRLARRFGNVITINLGLLLAAIMSVAFRYTEVFGLWLAIRFIGGMGLGLHWVLTEAWLARIVSDKGRTKVMAIYASAIGIGFAVGPVIIWVFGFMTVIPFYVIAALLILAALPIYMLRNDEPQMSFSGSGSPLLLIRRAPTVAMACIVAGGVDLALISLLPVVITRTPEAVPALTLSIVPAMAIGNVVLQYPIAIIADRFGLRKVGMIIATIGIALCSLIPFFLSSMVISLTLAFLGAGLVYGLYSIGLAMLSKRFSSGEIVAANAGFVIIFELSNLVGPALAGVLLDINIKLGLPIFLVGVGLFYLVISWLRRNANPDR